MTTPLWVLLAFAGWTLLTLAVGVGFERVRKIVARQAQPTDFPADVPHGGDRYRRAMRAHANCVENLPVYAAVAVVLAFARVDTPGVDFVAVLYLLARIGQTLVHVVPSKLTNAHILARFGFFVVQLMCLVSLGVAAIAGTSAAS